jgi:signal transduction histidine kinase
VKGSDPAGLQRRVGRLRRQLAGPHGDGSPVESARAELDAVAAKLEAEAARLDDVRAKLRDERRQLDEDRVRSAALFDVAPVACLVTDDNGIIRQVNAAAIELFDDPQLVGKPLVLRVAAPDRARVHAQATVAGRGGATVPAIVGLDRARSPAVRAQIRCAPAGEDRLLWLVHDVTEQEATQDRLRESMEHDRASAQQLRDLDDVRDAFILAVSHDLQAPIAAIAGLAGLLVARSRIAVADRQRMVEQIRAAAEHVLADLRELLDLERLHRGDVGLEPRRVDVAAIVRTAVDAVDLGDRRAVVDARPTVAVVDPLILERILHNLLVNTARHTPPGTTVWLRFSREPDGLLLVVEDDGPGVPDEMRPRVFDLFSRQRQASAGGLGVGLALVRQFAELHGGNARVEPRRERGASFQVLLGELPLAPGAGG